LDRSTGGLMYYGARYYLPELRRFISADSIVPGATNPQAFNRYAYTLNNPIKYVDPTGHGAEICGTNVDCWVHAAMKALKKGGGGGGNSSSPEQDVHEELEAGATGPGGGGGTQEESVPGKSQGQIGFSQAAIIQSQQIKAIDAMSHNNGWRGAESAMVGAKAIGGYGNDDWIEKDPEPEGPIERLIYCDGCDVEVAPEPLVLCFGCGGEVILEPLVFCFGCGDDGIDLGRIFADPEPEGGGFEGPYLEDDDNPYGGLKHPKNKLPPPGKGFPYIPPKTKEKLLVVNNPEGEGYIDKKGRIWEWDNTEKHWDVQYGRRGKYHRVSPEGEILKKGSG